MRLRNGATVTIYRSTFFQQPGNSGVALNGPILLAQTLLRTMAQKYGISGKVSITKSPTSPAVPATERSHMASPKQSFSMWKRNERLKGGGKGDVEAEQKRMAPLEVI